MADQALDCSKVEEQELEARYIQGALSDEEAEAVEAHYFGCDRCWNSLQQSLELHAALAGDAGSASVPGAPGGAPAPPNTLSLARGGASRPAAGVSGVGAPGRVPGRPLWASRWWPAVAAAAVILTVGTYRWQHGGGATTSVADVERGVSAELPVHPSAPADSLRASWSRVPGAEQYRVRLFTADGTLLLDRQVVDTSVSVGRAVLPAGTPPGGAFWSVQAVDATRQSLARSRLTPAIPPAPSP
jgi:hypothetical protein